MPDDDAEERARRERERSAKSHRRGRRKRREALEAAAGMDPTVPVVPPRFTIPPRSALEIHVGQLHAYLLQVDDDVTIGLEARVRLLTAALPAFCRAVETADFGKRMVDLEAALERFHRKPT